MIELHGQEKWDRSVAMREKLDAERAAAGIAVKDDKPAEVTEDDLQALAANAPPFNSSILVLMLLIGLVLTTAYGVRPLYSAVSAVNRRRAAFVALLLADLFLVGPLTSPGRAAIYYALPIIAIVYGLKTAMPRLGEVDLFARGVPAAGADHRRSGVDSRRHHQPDAGSGARCGRRDHACGASAADRAGHAFKRAGSSHCRTIAIIVFLIVGVNFDLRTGVQSVGFENWVAIIVTAAAYHVAFAGLLYSCWVLWADKILAPIVQESAKVTAMVFAILIGSQMLNLVLISFGGEHYIQQFLKSFDEEWLVFLIVMVILFPARLCARLPRNHLHRHSDRRGR